MRTSLQCANVSDDYDKHNVVHLNREFELSLSEGASDNDDGDGMPMTLPTDSSHSGSIRKVSQLPDRDVRIPTDVFHLCFSGDRDWLWFTADENNSPPKIITMLRLIKKSFYYYRNLMIMSHTIM